MMMLGSQVPGEFWSYRCNPWLGSRRSVMRRHALVLARGDRVAGHDAACAMLGQSEIRHVTRGSCNLSFLFGSP